MPGPYTFDPIRQRYRDGNGRFLARREVRSILDQTITNSRQGVQNLANQLAQGRITVGDWELQMRRLVKNTQITSGALAKGGFAHMDFATYGRIGQRVRAQYGYLSDLTTEIQTGQVPISEGLAARMHMYLESGRGTYHAVERLEMSMRGFDEEANILEGGVEHCEGCLAASNEGWVRIGNLPNIGSRDCLTNCLCELRYRNSATGAEIDMGVAA